MKGMYKVNNLKTFLIYALFLKNKHIFHTINGVKYMVEYSRLSFWTYEKPSWRLFFKEKLCYWSAQVWDVFPNGGKCGFGTASILAIFPRKYAKKFLIKESSRLYKNMYSKKSKQKEEIK